jgi:hypothetical protein
VFDHAFAYAPLVFHTKDVTELLNSLLLLRLQTDTVSGNGLSVILSDSSIEILKQLFPTG